ncbi:hypothetical protein ON010_g9041 [Phytophthora cinnamomi]|nr:hypothetical protein ON010_g9041 [Phytophthora cinnamomi]
MQIRAPQNDPDPLRKRKWDEMNIAFARNKNAKANGFTGISDVSFNDVKGLIGERIYIQGSKHVADEKLGVLHQYLGMLANVFPLIESSSEATRLHFIVPLLASVCVLFNGDVQMRAESPIVGKRVHADGAFEIVLQRGDKRVCIVEAKRRDYDHGLSLGAKFSRMLRARR